MKPFQIFLTIALTLAELAVLVRAMLRPHREPASRLAWVIVIIVAPIVGMIAYLVIGEARVSRGRRDRCRSVDEHLPRPPSGGAVATELARSFYGGPFALAQAINKLSPSTGNSAALLPDSNASIDAMAADIDAARNSVHICFYIWLDDSNGLKLKEAVVRAGERGIAVRVLADAFGSRDLIRSAHWRDMQQSGAEMRVALPVGNPLWTMIRGRVDLRNHRKLLIVDNCIAWCGSQNAADPEFRVKPRYAPWVDIMTRWEGQVARDCQFLFISDWMGERGEDLSSLLTEPPVDARGDIIAQVIGTGPTVTFDAMTACFTELVHSARHELVITTPYFVPDEQLLFAILSAARRGVKTVLVVPHRNDSRFVAAASRSHYRDLLAAGVELYEYECGLLHAKTMVVDTHVALIGSANLDRRSSDLNFENNILFANAAFAAAIRARQDSYLADSTRITREEVAGYSLISRLWQNLLAMFGPLL